MGVNDFSIMTSSRNGKDMSFLGPAAYINHACSPNTKWVLQGECWYAKTVKAINAGEEISANYGKHFFGLNNENCECESCNNKKKGDNLFSYTFRDILYNFIFFTFYLIFKLQ